MKFPARALYFTAELSIVKLTKFMHNDHSVMAPDCRTLENDEQNKLTSLSRLV